MLNWLTYTAPDIVSAGATVVKRTTLATVIVVVVVTLIQVGH